MVNVVGTVNMFEAIRAAGGRTGLAYASSAAVFGDPVGRPAGLVGDASELRPDSFYGVYKAANEGTAKVYSRDHGIGSIGLRPFIVYGLGRDQGMTSDPTKAMLAAAAGVPFKIKFGGSVLLTYAPDCARVFIASARAAAAPWRSRQPQRPRPPDRHPRACGPHRGGAAGGEAAHHLGPHAAAGAVAAGGLRPPQRRGRPPGCGPGGGGQGDHQGLPGRAGGGPRLSGAARFTSPATIRLFPSSASCHR